MQVLFCTRQHGNVITLHGSGQQADHGQYSI